MRAAAAVVPFYEMVEDLIHGAESDMKSICWEISSYNLLNYLLPGVHPGT